jgi:hypothetical protein
MDTSTLTGRAHAKAASTARRSSVVVKWLAWAIAFAVLGPAYDGLDPARSARTRLDACVAAYRVPQRVPARAPIAAPQQFDARNQALAEALLACSTQP